MADVIINGTTYSGSPTNTGAPQRPVDIERKILKIGRMLKAADGSTSWIQRGQKSQFTIHWGDTANQTTRDAIATVYQLTTTFSYTHSTGVAYTVLCVGDDEYTEVIKSDRTNAYKYDGLTLVLREA